MKNSVAVVTGASQGIGRSTILDAALHGGTDEGDRAVFTG